jgi:23S rRNA-/tRNA-specific pseudouridylate synthase
VIRKTYTMLVHGQIKEPGLIENELIKDRELNRVRIAAAGQDSAVSDRRAEVREQSRRAVTVYRPVQIGKRATLVEADLITGRSHQLRVHMAAIGHPLVGDWLYGTEDHSLITRPALHAAYILVQHPVTGEMIEYSAPLPADMKRLLEQMHHG